jgi:hypothetical protein
MNCTGVASMNCTQAGSIQCWSNRSPSIGSTSGADNTSPIATGANPAQGEASSAASICAGVRGS